jgi:hypothetical protein
MITIEQMADWILEHRGNKVFKDQTKEQIAIAIAEGIESNTVLYEATSDDRILGMILAVKMEDKKIIFVVENLAMNLKILRHFLHRMIEMYPGYNIEGIRHSKIHKFITEKLKLKI